jgi:hypothetical protein
MGFHCLGITMSKSNVYGQINKNTFTLTTVPGTCEQFIYMVKM